MTYNPATGALVGAWQSDDGIIGAGGFMTRADAATDGTMVCGSDVAGPFIRRSGDSRWTRLWRPGDNIDLSSSGWVGDGIWEVAICAGNSNVIAWIQYGYLWRTTDGGATVVQTALPNVPDTDSNDGTYRKVGRMLVIDPINPLVMFLGTPTKVKKTADGGATWTDIATATIPAPATAGTRYCLGFDPASATTEGKTQGLYCHSPGNALYRSTDGGATWSTVAGSPSIASDMVIAADGYVHICGTGVGEETAQYRRWNGSSWIAPSGIAGKSIALSHSNVGHVYLAGSGSDIRCSTDNGVNWTAATNPQRHANAIPWHAWTSQEYMANGRILFQHGANRLWCFDGIGAWYKDTPPTNGAAITWEEASVGIENMIMGIMTCSEEGDLLAACHDRQGFVIRKAQAGQTYPSRHVLIPTFGHGACINQAPGNPDFLVASNFWDASPDARSDGGYSTDRGRTWTRFPGAIGVQSAPYLPVDTELTTGFGGGPIIALSETVFIQRQTSNCPMMWTKDGGLTWNVVPIGDQRSWRGAPQYVAAHRPLVCDPYTANQAYFYQGDDDVGDAPNNLAARGVWRLNYNPATEVLSATRIRATRIINPTDYYHVKFLPYGAAGDWLFYAGNGSNGLHRSTDGMVNWTEVGGTDDVTAATSFGEIYGVGVSGSVVAGGPPAVMVHGFREGATGYAEYGVWLTIDSLSRSGGPRWKRIVQFPGHYQAPVWDACGDPTEFGVFYLGSSQGVQRLKFKDVRIGR